MLLSYYTATQDVQFAIGCIEDMITEFTYWEENFMITVDGYSLFKYNDYTRGPRPDYYESDKNTANRCKSKHFQEEIYTQLKSGSTSSIEFSSKYFIKSGTNMGNLSNTQCSFIIPVELNSVMYSYAQVISQMSILNEDFNTSAKYSEKAKSILDGMQNVLWSEEIGIWLDYDLINKKQRNYFTILNLIPIWAGAYNTSDSINISKRVINYLKQNNVDSFSGSVPFTLTNSGEQWDAPNVWPSSIYGLTIALYNLQQPETTKLAYKYAERFIISSYIGYNETGFMYEKVDKNVLFSFKIFGLTVNLFFSTMQMFRENLVVVVNMKYKLDLVLLMVSLWQCSNVSEVF